MSSAGASDAPGAETADGFVDRINREFADLWLEGNAAGWTQATYINVDTQLLNARATEPLQLSVPAPAPNDPAKRAELASLLAGMEAKYGSARYCPQGPESCRDEVQLKAVLNASGLPCTDRTGASRAADLSAS